MAETTGIGWTDATVNFVIGCTRVGPGCDACYAAAFADRKWGIQYEAGGERRVTKSGFKDPGVWQRKHDKGLPAPRWVFACSLSDFFDNEWPEEIRARAWAVIKDTPSLRWQIVTKRIGNVTKMLPADWNNGLPYQHVGIVATMVNQAEYDRDHEKLFDLYRYGVKWTGLSIEPQIGYVKIISPIDWVITGGESRQTGHFPRPYPLDWARSLIGQCARAGVPVFVKQLGDNPHQFDGHTSKFNDGNAASDMSLWPGDIRVRQMPRIYDND